MPGRRSKPQGRPEDWPVEPVQEETVEPAEDSGSLADSDRNPGFDRPEGEAEFRDSGDRDLRREDR